LAALATRLEALSPLAVLARGYSLTYHEADGRLVHSAAELHNGDLLRTRLAEGEAISRVEQVKLRSRGA
jgi:exodeoxyribonuclease VII large subunit